MKALLSVAVGGPETLEMREIEAPVAGLGQLLVTVKACAINFPDVLIIEDKYQFRPQRPFAPGSEIAGIVEAVGEAVTGFKVGDRIAAVTGHGGLAEQIAIPATAAYKLPPERSFSDGAALLMTYATSIHALVDRGKLKQGDTLLVLGAAGGVGLAAVELGVAFGARVIAAVSTEAKAEAARAAGAADVVLYGTAPFDKEASKALADAFKAACPDGYDVIYDAVGGDYCEPALRAIGWEGRYLVVGFPAGIPRLPLNLTLLKSCDVCGVFWGAFAARNPEKNATHVARLFRLWADGRIAPRVNATFAFDQGGDAIAHLASRKAIGKVVVTIAD
ncbi:MAG: NADPH:quinone oxidoreductase family protein [Sphingomonadaceae bacterium]